MGLFRLPAKFLLLTACSSGFLVTWQLKRRSSPFKTWEHFRIYLPAMAPPLSESGDVVGYCTVHTNQNLLLSAPATHVFLYSNGVMTDLNVTLPPTAFPTAVNDAGVVVGGALKAWYLAGNRHRDRSAVRISKRCAPAQLSGPLGKPASAPGAQQCGNKNGQPRPSSQMPP